LYLVEEPQFAAANAPLPMEAMERARDIAGAPTSQSGAEAFAQARRSATLTSADKLAEAEALAPATVNEMRASGRIDGFDDEAVAARNVGRRIFVLRDGTWTDLRFESSLKVVEVEPFSDAYFELIDRLPALRAYFALGDQVIVAGDGLAVKLADGGLTSWRRRELSSVIAAFEGSL
jgi:hypothetical protein